MKFKYVAVMLAALILSACADATPAAPTGLPPTATEMATATPFPTSTATATATATLLPTQTPSPTATPKPLNPLSIAAMRQRTYPGSDITIEQTLDAGSNYRRYYVSYRSDGLKIYALMTVPNGTKPLSGWPVIVFNHGFIPPTVYRTTERYVAYVDFFARSGYIVFKSDYRGHDRSEGQAGGGYGAPDYTVDVLNALSSLKRYPAADPARIGMWGHSMGGQITLRSIVVSQDIKAAVIWAGVVASYPDMLANWHTRGGEASPPIAGAAGERGWRQSLINEYGTPAENPNFWASISPNSYLAEGVPPVQLHHDTGDSEVPFSFSQGLASELKDAGQTVDFYSYPGNDHNLANSFDVAMQRSLAWFNRYVKGS
jgi:uncharacterized protein